MEVELAAAAAVVFIYSPFLTITSICDEKHTDTVNALVNCLRHRHRNR